MTADWITLVGRAIVPAAVLTSFALFRKYFPPTQKSGLNRAHLDEKFCRANVTVYCAMTAIVILFVWSTHALLVSLNRYLALRGDSQGMQLFPQNAIWWFFPGFTALTLSWEITLQLWALFGNRKEVELFSAWSNQRAGYDCRRILRGMALMIAGPLGIATVLALPMHATLSRLEISDCGYAFSPCRIYPYSEARRLTEIEGFRDRYGKLTRRTGIVVHFADGRRWSSADWGDFASLVDPQLKELLLQRTGLALRYAQTEVDIP